MFTILIQSTLLGVTSDVVWQALIAAVLAVILKWFDSRAVERDKENTKKVEAVAQISTDAKDNASKNMIRTDDKLAHLSKVATATYHQGNSAMEAQLLLNSLLSERLASKTNDEFDIVAAKVSKDKYDAHKSKEVSVIASDAISEALKKAVEVAVDKKMADPTSPPS